MQFSVIVSESVVRTIQTVVEGDKSEVFHAVMRAYKHGTLEDEYDRVFVDYDGSDFIGIEIDPDVSQPVDFKVIDGKLVPVDRK